MAVGAEVTKAHLDQVALALCIRFRDWSRDVENLQRGLNGWDAARIAALGYSESEANQIISALLAMVKIRGVAVGADTLPAPQDLTALMYTLTGID